MKRILHAALPVKFLIFLFAVIPVFAWAAPLPFSKRPTEFFESSEFKVSMSFPCIYENTVTEKTNDANEVTRTLKVKCKSGDNTYILNVSKHPMSLTDPKGLAETSVNSFVKAVNGELKSRELYTQKGNEGLDALIYMPAQSKYVHYRVILLNRLQYQVIVINNSESLSAADRDFLQSFKMLE